MVSFRGTFSFFVLVRKLYKWDKAAISVGTRDVQENLCQELDIIVTFTHSHSKRCNTLEEFGLCGYWDSEEYTRTDSEPSNLEEEIRLETL
jgi:hypothetical protein